MNAALHNRSGDGPNQSVRSRARLVAIATATLVFGAANADPVFVHLGADDGLPAQVVWDVAQDGQGLIWLATSAGLARYDGIAVRVYRHDVDDPRSLINDEINDLFVDRTGALWVGTAGGVCRYDAATDSFDRFTAEPGSPGRLPAGPVLGVAEASDGALWVAAGDAGLFRLDRSSGAAVEYRHDASRPTSLAEGTVGVVYVDREQRLWVGTLGGGLDRLSADGASFEHIALGPLNDSEHNRLHDNVRAIHQDGAGHVWVGSDDGLNRFDAVTGARSFYSFDYERPDNPAGLSGQYVNAILEDTRGRLWIGTSEGIDRYDPQTNMFVRVARATAAAGGRLVNNILEDGTGVLWFAGRGVDRFDPVSESVASLGPPPSSPAEPIVAALGAVPLPGPGLFIDASGIVWIGSTSGLARFDPETDAWSAHLRVPEHPEYPDNSVYALHPGADGFVYVGIPQSIALYLPPRGFSPSLITLRGTPSALYQDRSGTIWAGMPYVGLARLPGRNGDDQEYFTSVADDPASLSSDYVFFMHEDSTGRFWLGTYDGLNLMDRETGRFQRFMFEAGAADALSHPQVRAMAEAADGSLWIGTGRGVDVLSVDAGVVRHVSASDGLSHDRINALVFDRAGALWIGTEGGLSRLMPATGEIRNFRVQQGLPDNEILRLALAPNGDLYAATHGALVRINPGDLSGGDAEPQVIVADISVLGAPDSNASDAGTEFRESRVTPTGMRLTHQDAIVSFDLAVLDYRDPARNRYAYMLEGLDDGWLYADGTQRRATYTTLPAGRYRFLYRGADSTGRWSSAAHSIDLTVLPAPWRTTWAYALYALAITLAAAGVVVLRTRAVTLRAHQLEATVRERTHEISEQRDTIKQQSERLEEAASAKDRLYANVSHEFRTPITVILGSLERVLQRDGAPDRRSYLEAIRRNAQRLLRLVEQFMVLARLDAARVARPSPQPAGQRVSLLVESFRTLAEDKGIGLTAKCEGLWVSCDADALETIVVNLVSNAIKYTPFGGRVSVAVERIDDGYVDIVVNDTGIGIPTEQQAKVFDRFYRATDAAEMAPGSGLGLALVRELVAANRGDISLVSESGAGTTVRVRLPEAAPVEAADVAKPSAKAALEVAALELPPAVVRSESESEDAGAAVNGSVARALIVEDNQDLCRHLEKVLGREFRCDFANDGSSGIERAIETVPDVIICDVMLPSVNGFEVVRQLKHDDRTCHVPIILLTARADEESRLAGLGVLADDYVTKPFSEPELRQRVDRLLAIREILRQRYGRHAGDIEKLKAELGARDRRFVDKVEQVLERHHTNAEFSLPEFASHLAMSERQLQRKLKALMNTTPRDHVRDYRLRKALRMIEAGERVSAVAFAVGFTSQSYFTSCFRAQFGMTPSEARARAEKPGAPRVDDGLS